MKKKLAILLTLAVLLPLSLLSYHLASGQSEPPPPASPETLAAVEAAIQTSIEQNRELTLVTAIFETAVENLRLSNDQQWAKALLVPVDPDSGEKIESEPGLALVQRQADDSWLAVLPADSRWADMLAEAPADLISAEDKAVWLQMYHTVKADLNAEPISGFYLPWEFNTYVRLSRSITHYEPLQPDWDMHYSFDFAAPYLHDDPRKMFNLHASRPGVVWRWRDSVPTCYDYTCTDDPGADTIGNYIVIKDDTTDPVTYHLYLHLAQDSIPDEIQWQGASVGQGQFLGKADNTGQSWGHHLHFQVHAVSSHYWGHGLDILFNEVTINGGRPRTQYEATTYPAYGSQWVSSPSVNYFLSQNPPPGDGVPPVGDILTPLTGEVYTTSIFLQGWASDEDPGLETAQFLALYNGSWQQIGPQFTTSLFSYTWDWCADAIPDGPVSLALRLVDKGGVRTTDLPGLRHVIKSGGCVPQPPACIPASDEVAIFDEINFGGNCQILATGVYTNSYDFGDVADNDTASILLGTGSSATLYSEQDLQGRSETISQSDANLAENRIGADTLSSLKVLSSAALPTAPAAQWPANASNFSTAASLDFVGMDTGGGTQFRLRLEGPPTPPDSGQIITTTWSIAPVWPLGNLPTGAYTWTIQAANPAGESTWSAARTFTVTTDPGTPPTPVSAPFSDDLEGDTSDWSKSGTWAVSTARVFSGSQSYRYSTPATEAAGSPHFGDLTSRPITLPVSANPYYLSFWYKYESESFYPHWDQRRVQISVDGGPFTDIYQLAYDPNLNEATLWLKASINLSPYYTAASPHTVRVRFHFHSLDSIDNDYEGWYLDDIALAAAAPPVCSDVHEPNQTPATATAIAYGDTVTAGICPPGDVDYYRFSGSAGDRLRVDIDAKSTGSDLDAILYLLDADGSSVLAVNDDEVLGTLQDPLLDYQLPRTGSYYLRLQAWNHPKGSGAYSLSLENDNFSPTVSLLTPTGDSFLPGNPIDLIASAADVGSGLARVEFWYHADDWLNGDWQLIGTDLSAVGGWSTPFDPTILGDMDDIAILTAAYDQVGNGAFDAAWNLRSDNTNPVVNISSLPNPVDTTALRLEWQASDTRSGLARVDVNLNQNGSGYSSLYADTTAIGDRWYIGQPGNSYAFQATAEDQAGNTAADSFTTSIPAAATLCATPDAWDISALDNDNTAGSASSFPLGAQPQSRNFCNPADGDWLNDQDWLSVELSAGVRYQFTATPQTDSSAVVIELYASNGSTLLASDHPATFGEVTMISWLAPADGRVYLRLYHSDGRVAGNGVSYQLLITHFNTFIPKIVR